MPARLRIAFGLLAMLPVAAAADRFHWGDGIVFGTSILSILPLAILLSTATEELSLRLGPSIGALLNALFGNATELIIALAALRANIKTIIIPEHNRKDLEEIPKELRDKLKFVPVKNIDQILTKAFV